MNKDIEIFAKETGAEAKEMKEMKEMPESELREVGAGLLPAVSEQHPINFDVNGQHPINYDPPFHFRPRVRLGPATNPKPR